MNHGTLKERLCEEAPNAVNLKKKYYTFVFFDGRWLLKVSQVSIVILC